MDGTSRCGRRRADSSLAACLPGERHFTVELDMFDGCVRVECDNGSQSFLPWPG
jgi:hypothetical protein